HRLERDHPEALAEGRDDDDRRLLDQRLHRRHVAEAADAVAGEAAQLLPERSSVSTGTSARAAANARRSVSWPLIGINRPMHRRHGPGGGGGGSGPAAIP